MVVHVLDHDPQGGVGGLRRAAQIADVDDQPVFATSFAIQLSLSNEFTS